MLKYNFKIEKRQNKVQEIECDSLYLSDDLTYISGITSPRYNLVDGQTIYVAEDGSSEFHPYPIQIFECEERGYVVYNQTYKISEYEYFGEKYRGFTFADGKTYIADGSNKIYIDVINSSLYWYESGTTTEKTSTEQPPLDLSKNTITIETKYPIYDSIVTINGIDYEVDFNYGKPTIPLPQARIDCADNIRKVIKFFIRKKSDYKVNVEHISFTSPFKYVLIDELEHDEISGKDFIVKKKRYLTELINEEELDNISDTLNYNGETMQVFTEWRDIKSGDINSDVRNATDDNNVKKEYPINVYLDDNDYSFKPSNIIKVTNNTLSPQEYIVETEGEGVNQKSFVKIYGVKYYVNADKKRYVNYINKEYELFTENGTYYIIVDGSIILLENSSQPNHMKRVMTSSEMNDILSSTTYEIKEYENITINNTDYFVINKNNLKYIKYDPLYPIKLSVSDVNGSNRLRCTFLYGDSTDIDAKIKEIVDNHQDYVFELENKLFEEGNVNNIPSNEKDYSTIRYKIYKSIDNINLQLNLNNRYDAKLHQEFVQERDFFEVERRKAINDIVDMEKDIYYPATKTENGFINVDKIIIDLHFRTRNLEDWKINNNVYKPINNYLDCNWNIIDYYNKSDFQINFKKHNYYQPSDLLYFLKFTDDDVFYQKDKIGKSFLRLSFYDSPNVNKQNLLATSTVFMAEGELYKKFINNRVDKGNFISVNENNGERIEDNNISVNLEPFSVNHEPNAENEKFTFNENERLSSSFVIKNKYESAESSEGFYLYLFKNYSSGMHERTIYLKVEFNHAGVGRTLTFMQPYKVDNNKVKSMLELPTDLDMLTSGVTLQEMYNHIFIPIQVKYDFVTKRYYYFLPNWLVRNNDNSTMHLNLYEFKIANS